ncbi:hypothetical protein [Acidocella sp.]|uniref:hypothetical protein n=1 Tax=Acidocella sp. TaxID=50710 RepID=UPI002629AB97|nr:hypothetical protein [Acidocella sp.]
MTHAIAPAGGETHIRAIVYREGENYVAQCLEYDIAAQAGDLNVLLNRLYLTVEAEFALCAKSEASAHDCIPRAPNYYHSLWDKRSVALQRIHVPAPSIAEKSDSDARRFEIEAALAAA